MDAEKRRRQMREKDGRTEVSSNGAGGTMVQYCHRQIGSTRRRRTNEGDDKDASISTSMAIITISLPGCLLPF